ncbi:ribonuclease HI [Sphingomonas oleivorans]|uniref:Ribonuclease HI n=1 Tax=Sphingomonas oleivorans TaxID=1735121 RepID=A0A2T5FZF2_9SPHN|nr:ribonuclease HI family protein [Sphingomonas oleivorans]PTQ12055.1 ribonuclease HI [Sphingomonas oleivorans]
MPERSLKLFFDGGCRPNPGAMEVAVVARGITYHKPDLGHGTNNDAEWLALIHALQVARSLGARDILLVGDSALVVNQANGAWKCRGAALQRHLGAFKALAAQFARVRVRHIGRSQNLAGIALEKQHGRW